LTFSVERGTKEDQIIEDSEGDPMSSRTGKTRMARKVKLARTGKIRKRKEQNKGTTPKFAVHKK